MDLYIKLIGTTRFGNNLFQIISGYLYYKKHKDKINDLYIWDEFNTIKIQNLEYIFSNFKFKSPDNINESLIFKNEIFNKYEIPDKYLCLNKDIIWEKSYNQNYNYFIDLNKNEIINLLNLNILNYKKYKCVIYVRGGDYFINGNELLYNKLSKEYYINALNKLNLNINDCIVCSDDIKYAKQLFGMNFIYNDDTVISDFILGINAENIILANSTFCIFSAYLSNAKNIIRPKFYFYKKNICNFNPNLNEIYNNDWIII